MRPDMPFAAALAGVLIAAVAITSWWWTHDAKSQAPSRVAVAPISALGSVTTTQAAQGLTDQIRTSLNDAHIPTVSASDSTALSGAAAEQRVKQQGIGYTIEGTLQASGDLLVARIHLDDRMRHASLWSYQVNGVASDPVSLNYDVAQSIAGVVSCAYRALGPSGLKDIDLLSRYLRVCQPLRELQ